MCWFQLYFAFENAGVSGDWWIAVWNEALTAKYPGVKGLRVEKNACSVVSHYAGSNVASFDPDGGERRHKSDPWFPGALTRRYLHVMCILVSQLQELLILHTLHRSHREESVVTSKPTLEGLKIAEYDCESGG